MVRKQGCYFSEITLRGTVFLTPKMLQPFLPFGIDLAAFVFRPCLLYELHRGINRNDEIESLNFLSIDNVTAKSKQPDYFTFFIDGRPARITVSRTGVCLQYGSPIR